VVCNKEDVVLLRCENRENCRANNSYRILFNVHNPHFPIHSIVGLKLYTLLYELNRDVIHTFKVVNETETNIETVTLFKPFGRDFGISPKAMHTVSTMQLEPGVCIFNSVDVQSDTIRANEINNIPKKYERIFSTHSKLIVYFLSSNDLQFDFTFELSDGSGSDIREEEEESPRCPIYMENSVALMIKKMFCRLKEFTERMA
jgi:hypothetical protein